MLYSHIKSHLFSSSLLKLTCHRRLQYPKQVKIHQWWPNLAVTSQMKASPAKTLNQIICQLTLRVLVQLIWNRWPANYATVLLSRRMRKFRSIIYRPRSTSLVTNWWRPSQNNKIILHSMTLSTIQCVNSKRLWTFWSSERPLWVSMRRLSTWSAARWRPCWMSRGRRTRSKGSEWAKLRGTLTGRRARLWLRSKRSPGRLRLRQSE
jgi:hypothetical protein